MALSVLLIMVPKPSDTRHCRCDHRSAVIAQGGSAANTYFGGVPDIVRRVAFRRFRDDKDRLWASRRSQAEILGRMPVSRDQEESDDYDRQNDYEADARTLPVGFLDP